MPKPKGPPPTLPSHSEHFLQDACQPHSKTEASYRCALINFQRFMEAGHLTPKKTPLPPYALRRETLADYYSWLKEESYRNASIRLYLSAVGQYLTWLEASQLISTRLRVAEMQIVLNKKSQRGRRLRPDRRGSDAAVGALLGCYEEELKQPLDPKQPRAKQYQLVTLRNHALLHTLYATAGRAAEVVSLQRADVAEGQATQFEITGKSNKKRMMFLTAPAQAAIQEYLKERTDSASALFVSHGANKEQPLSTRALWGIVNEAAKKVFGTDRKGRPLKRVGPHAFRHLRAQDLSNEGMSITSLQTLLGHESIETTRRTYAPKTLPEKVLDELETYGQDLEHVIRRGRKAAKQSTL